MFQVLQVLEIFEIWIFQILGFCLSPKVNSTCSKLPENYDIYMLTVGDIVIFDKKGKAYINRSIKEFYFKFFYLVFIYYKKLI